MLQRWTEVDYAASKVGQDMSLVDQSRNVEILQGLSAVIQEQQAIGILFCYVNDSRAGDADRAGGQARVMPGLLRRHTWR